MGNKLSCKWQMVKLGEIFKIASGGTPLKTKNEYYENGTVFWVKTGDLKEKYIKKAKVDKISELGLQNSSAKVFPENTVLVAMYGATIGATSILPFEASTNQACAAFLPIEKCLSEFLYYFLCSSKNNLIKLGVGGAQPNISATLLKNYKIPLPPLEEQQKIAKNLDLASELVKLYKTKLEELDKLIQSVFYDMFGDPVANEKGWEVEILKQLCSKIGSGATPKGGKESYKTSGISLIRSMNVHNGYFKYVDLAYIDDEQAKQLENVTICKQDVLINITGASVARTCVAPSDVLPARVNQHVSILRCRELLIPMFLNRLLSNEVMQAALLHIGTSNGATREAITKSQLENIKIILPPLQLQQKFGDIVTKIEEQKTEVNKALKDAEMLYNSLMQEYFE